MAKPNSEMTDSVSSEKDKQIPKLIKKFKEDKAKLMNRKTTHLHHKETHGMSDDINENTQTKKVKGPSVFGRAKEEIEAIVHTVHAKKESTYLVSTPKKQGLAEKHNVKRENEGNIKKSSHYHHKETHGMSDDIDETTSIDEVKGPNVFQRTKEEIEAVIEAIQRKKEYGDFASSPTKEAGFLHIVERS